MPGMRAPCSADSSPTPTAVWTPPALAGADLHAGTYELVFETGVYFARAGPRDRRAALPRQGAAALFHRQPRTSLPRAAARLAVGLFDLPRELTRMEAFDLDWLRLVARWIHLIVGIAWIGASFYFVWQDDSLEPAPEDPGQDRLQGEVWMVHGGGFYHARKFKVAPPNLPERLHWFKWEAYSTWLSGISLLILIYYFGASIYMLPPGSGLTPFEAVAIGVTSIGGAWVLYDLLCRSPLGRDDRLLAVAVTALVAGLAYGLTHLLSGRAAFIHVGAAMGTIMVANVFFVIIPNQREAVDQMLRGEAPDPALGRGKQTAQRAQHLFHPAGAVPDDLQPLRHGHRPRLELGAAAGDRGGRRGGASGVRAGPFRSGPGLDAAGRRRGFRRNRRGGDGV